MHLSIISCWKCKKSLKCHVLPESANSPFFAIASMSHVLKSRILFRNLRFKESEEVSKATPASIDLSLTSRILGHGAPFMIFVLGSYGRKKCYHPKVLLFAVDRDFAIVYIVSILNIIRCGSLGMTFPHVRVWTEQIVRSLWYFHGREA